MHSKLASLTAIALGAAGFVAACSSASVPAGSDNGDGGGGADTGTGLCGSAACAKGELCCPQACSSTLACLAISHCPSGWEGTCPAQGDSGRPDASSGDSGPGPQPDAAIDCCPVGYDMYACNEKGGGGQGLACHNPALGCASSLTCGEGCDPVVTGRCGSTSDLKWYETCGYPVCHTGPDAGPVDSGTCPVMGSACTTKGATCGTPDEANCGVTLVCDDHDPRAMGCPKSSRKFKNGIEYVDDAELQALHDETLRVKLATYQYKGEYDDPNPTHLGFIIEDNPQSLSVERGFDRVDMYGYVSMVVAGLQVQEKEIAALRSELEATQRRAASCNAPRK